MWSFPPSSAYPPVFQGRWLGALRWHKCRRNPCLCWRVLHSPRAISTLSQKRGPMERAVSPADQNSLRAPKSRGVTQGCRAQVGAAVSERPPWGRAASTSAGSRPALGGWRSRRRGAQGSCGRPLLLQNHTADDSAADPPRSFPPGSSPQSSGPGPPAQGAARPLPPPSAPRTFKSPCPGYEGHRSL